ncbi:hypothetical protein EZS27_038466 [termite gut metagenome]|uniref:RloB domain-containing protein n=1 Tax=termite gut metagenome TaxID=433724 RepID=A0A5J4PKU4_9ZZZZ
MNQPWSLKTEDKRVADSKPTFIIFCEDTVSECWYFKFFETDKIKVNLIENQKSKMDNVINAIVHCKDNGLFMVDAGGNEILNSSDIHIWCVFDRDIGDASEVSKGDVSFDESIKTAKSKGFKVAWSNDAFELWVLLHIEKVDATDVNYKTREYYYERLTRIFSTVPNPNQDLEKALKHESFGYKKDLKKATNFRTIVRPYIIPHTYTAINRAKDLEKYHHAKLHDNEKVPCTLVYELVEELLATGGKIPE